MTNREKFAEDCEQLAEWLEKFKEYQQLEEQGRLIKLPCKVGDTVWDNDYGRPCAYTITAFSFGECEEYICEPVTTKEVVFYYTNSSGSITGSFAESEIGKSVFLNKSEAEEKTERIERCRMTISEFFKEKYSARKDKENIYGVGMSDAEFRHFIIQYLLPENWYVVDPIGQTQVNEIAIYEILTRHSKKFRKERKKYLKELRGGENE